MVKRLLISLFLLVIFVWLIWSSSGRKIQAPTPKAYLSIVQEINPSDSLERNIVGIQPFMDEHDYLQPDIFKRKIELYLQIARDSGFLKSNTLVLYPEYIGTWLVLQGEKHVLAEKKTINEAMSTLVMSNIFDFSLAFLKSKEKDKAAASIFRMKAKEMAKTYFETFSSLAQTYQVYITAGSIILPKPSVISGKLHVDPNGPLYNVSFLFDPQGQIIGPPIYKAFPVASELPFLSSGESNNLPVFDLPMGKISILVCADSWYEDAYLNTIENSAEIVLVPSFCPGDSTMNSPWKGYSGSITPTSINKSDINLLTEGEAWKKYALPGKISQTSAQVGLNIFLKGELWDLGADGQPLAYFRGDTLSIQTAEQAGIWSLNF
ncbi:carbon-nitrogen hydrolase family protein [Algoriphagus algorifonticola]|uniref:carbon-nitrogen hydrolase family protein n=1 Tax=Algoriphagus algorifonticola TaxID=2593007 RepID=UPI00119D64A4|nr:carbon-nitrogen hydrolase family protein [Algoriphagus algorifonticola]